ncbi:MAG TPA: DUF6789 family protein [Candidatus Limnocylindrales bacterium]
MARDLWQVPLADALARGVAAGIAATAAMSVVLVAAERSGDMSRMPPHEIASNAISKSPIGAETSGRARRRLGWVAHFAFGAAAGATFEVVRRRLPPRVPAVPAAVAFAAVVWGVSYLGWIPALGLMPPATDDEPGRQPALLLAHAVFGGVLGVTATGLDNRPAAPSAA